MTEVMKPLKDMGGKDEKRHTMVRQDSIKSVGSNRDLSATLASHRCGIGFAVQRKASESSMFSKNELLRQDSAISNASSKDSTGRWQHVRLGAEFGVQRTDDVSGSTDKLPDKSTDKKPSSPKKSPPGSAKSSSPPGSAKPSSDKPEKGAPTIPEENEESDESPKKQPATPPASPMMGQPRSRVTKFHDSHEV